MKIDTRKDIQDVNRNHLKQDPDKDLKLIISRMVDDNHPLGKSAPTPLGTFYPLGFCELKDGKLAKSINEITHVQCVLNGERKDFARIKHLEIVDYTYNGLDVYGLVATLNLTPSGKEVWKHLVENDISPRFVMSVHLEFNTDVFDFKGVRDFILSSQEDLLCPDGYKANFITV